MEKMKMETVDGVSQNIEKIAELFPSCVTEVSDKMGGYKRSINFNALKQLLMDDISDGAEAYEFTWVGKKSSMVEANKPIRKTLRPQIDKSREWDNTDNIYIEGDNVEALKLLQESYLGKVKMIYIDPPYNTGKDSFAYFDSFEMNQDEYDEGLERYDEDGNLNFTSNTSANPRFHSAWCSMIYPCLLLARNLLTDDGSIFISIDNHEIDNCLKICDEIFGVDNRIACIANVNNPKGRSDEKNVATAHEYIVVYQKSKAVFSGFDPEENVLKRYNKVDESGKKYRHIDLRKTGDSDRREDRPNMFYYFYYNQSTGDCYPSFDESIPEGYVQIMPMKGDGSFGRWRVGFDTAKERMNILDPVYMSVKKRWTIMERDYLSDDLKVKATSAWTYKDLNSERGTEQFVALGFDKNDFPRPKPLGTVLRAIQLATKDDDIIMDFFSGSATTAQALMSYDLEHNEHRKYILVQWPEEFDEDSSAYTHGYKNICELAEDRIKRAGDKILEEAEKDSKKIDIGYRVFKIDESNMNDVYYSADRYSQGMIAAMESNIKSDRTDLDLLFGCVLDWGLPLSLPYSSEEMSGVKIHTYNDGDLIACFDENVPEDVVREIAKRQPLRAVFRDSSFSNSPAKINVGEIFKAIAPDTSVKVI